MDIVKSFKKAGGLLDENSLGSQQAEVYEPLAVDYRGYTVLQNRPPSQGMLLLQMLNIIEGFDIGSLGHQSAESIHLMVEAKKLAFADRNAYLSDPAVEPMPLEMLVSKEHAANRRMLINPRQASDHVPATDPIPAGTDTCYFCIADQEGNTISFIHSLYHPFGSAFVADGTGIVFNNRHRGFRLEEGHPNTIAPGKRPNHTLNAYTVLKGGKPFLVGGTPGADFQVQGNLQMITGVIDHKLDPQQAVDAARWVSLPGSDPDTLGQPHSLQLEPRIPKGVAATLESMGHKVTWDQDGMSHGIVQLIQMQQDNDVKIGASDPRGDGHAAAI